MIRKHRATSAEGNPTSHPTDKTRTHTTAATAGRKISRGFDFRLGQHPIQSHPDSFSGYLPRKHFSWSSLSPKCSFLHSLHQQSIEYSGHRVKFKLCTEKSEQREKKQIPPKYHQTQNFLNHDILAFCQVTLIIFLRINTFPMSSNITHLTLQWITYLLWRRLQ